MSHPWLKGRGSVGLLLKRLTAECEALDLRLMVAVVGDKASRGSIRLHESLGFKPAGVRPGVGYKHGRWLATMLMQCSLGPGPLGPPIRPIPA